MAASSVTPAQSAPASVGPAVQLSPAELRKRREEWFYAQRSDTSGLIPAQALARARVQEAALNSGGVLPFASRRPYVPFGGRSATANGSSESAWTLAGPRPFVYASGFGTNFYGGTNSGRATAITATTNRWYINTAAGGVWRTTDSGTTWTPLTDGQASLAGTSILVSPGASASTDTIWVGTGEGNCSGDSYYGAGILTSTDGGAHWTQTGASQFGAAAVVKIALDPTSNGQTLYAAATRCISGSISAGLLGAGQGGLAKSTDGGNTWSVLTIGTNVFFPGMSAGDVLVAPNGTLYVTRQFASDSSFNGIYISSDGGQTVTKLTSGLPASSSMGRIQLAMAPSSSSVLYAVISNRADSTLLGVYKSTDGGTTWSQTALSDTNDQWDYDTAVVVDPTDSNTVFVGGVDVFKSTDGGGTWSNLTDVYGSRQAIHPDQHGLAVVNDASHTLIAVNDGGVFKSTDGGGTWSHANGSGSGALAITQGYRGASAPDGATFYIGTQDNGEIKYAGEPVWTEMYSGDGGFTEVDFNTPATVYEEYIYLAVARSDDSGLNWATKTTGLPAPSVRQTTAAFIAPFVMDPNTPTMLYAGTNQVFKTTDRGESWSALGSGALTSRYLTAIGVSKSSPNTLYTGDRYGAIWVTADGGATWTQRTTGLPTDTSVPTGRWLTDLAVDPTTATTAYATYSGFNAYPVNGTPVAGHLFKTTNGGASWTNISGTLPDAPLNSVTIDPANTNIVYVGGDLGVYKSQDSGATWAKLDGLPGASVQHVVLNRNGDKLFAVTHGRSVYVATRSTGGVVPTPSPFRVYDPLGLRNAQP